MKDDCPICGAPASHREHLSDGWQFCNGCGRCLWYDEHGTVLRTQPTNHAPTRPPRPFNVPRVAVGAQP